jgi:putative FmdB family regulatory protein
MPTYDYNCASCGGFDALRSLSDRNNPCACPSCGEDSPRVFVHAPRQSLLSSDQRFAYDTNERSQHAPMMSRDSDGRYARLRHPAGCGCCSTGSRKTSTVTAPNGAKAFPTKRPWMISH